MLHRVEPLRNELDRLEKEADKNKVKQEQVNKLVAELEHSIAGYKEEYAQLISQAQAIKSDLESVEIKVSSWWQGYCSGFPRESATLQRT